MDDQVSKSLVADYDSTSEEDEPSCPKPRDHYTAPLASALEMLDRNAGNVSGSVFTNPYKNAENYEQSVLEKHVKMTTLKEPEAKKKVCFKFRKGKCRLGEKCHFLHQNPNRVEDSDRRTSEDEAEGNPKERSKKRRCGLKDDLIPPKKYLKTFNKCK